jgi:hypothetical protein
MTLEHKRLHRLQQQHAGSLLVQVLGLVVLMKVAVVAAGPKPLPKPSVLVTLGHQGC